MDINQEISEELWEAIKVNYEAKKYSESVHDSIRLIRDLLREKTGSHQDGIQLVGYALGGNPPRLKLNPNQTTSQIDEQNGYQFLLRGIFQGIRNPREHDHINDDKKTADTLICFINHLLDKIGSTEPTFSIDAIIRLITEDYFSPQKEYLEPLLLKISKEKHKDILFKLYELRHNNGVSLDSLFFTITYIFQTLDKDDQQRYLDVVSNALRDEDLSLIYKTLSLVPNGTWDNLEVVAKGRIEQILCKELSSNLDKSYWKFVNSESDHYPHFCDFKKQAIRFLGDMDRQNEIISIAADKFLFEVKPSWIWYLVLEGLLSYLPDTISAWQIKIIFEGLDDKISEDSKSKNKPDGYHEVLIEIGKLDSSILELMPNVKRMFSPTHSDSEFGELTEDDFLDF